jgi:flagellar motor switch protein FliG
MIEGQRFSFLNRENLRRLAYMFLLRKEEPWLIAAVASHMDPALARELLQLFPPDWQRKIALMSLTNRFLTPEELSEIDNEVRENVDFIVEGMERLSGELLDTDHSTRYNIITYLRNEKPEIYAELRKHYLVFEDLAMVPDRDMQIILRELRTEPLARALLGAPPALLNHVFSNMSTGAGALLRETMAYLTGLDSFAVDEARFTALELITHLENEGRIAPRAQYVRRVV